MKLGLYILVIVLMGSCSAERRLSRILSNHPELMEVDTIETINYRDTIIYRDTVINIALPKDTVKLTDTLKIECKEDSLIIPMDTLMASTNIADARTWLNVSQGKIERHLEVINKDSLLQIKIDSLVKESYYWQTKYLESIKTVKIKECPKWKNIMSWIGIILSFIIIIGLFFGVRKAMSFDWFNK